MTIQKPLTYISQKCVLKYLDAASRLELQKCPTMRSFEKIFPLKIDYLHLEPFAITVNKTTYKLGVVRRYRDKDTPVLIPDENSTGGFAYDVDRFGVKNRLLVVEPGDVLIKEENWQETSEEEVKRKENNEIHEIGLKKLRRDRKEQVSDNKEFQEIQAKMLPYQFRRDDFQPPFSHFIRLTTESMGRSQIEVLPYECRLHEAMGYLMEKLFEGRYGPIQVKTLSIHHEGCLRSLGNLKFLIRNLKIRKDVTIVMYRIRPHLHQNSFPLESFETVKVREYYDQWITTAQKLIMSGPCEHLIIQRLSHKRIHLENCKVDYVEDALDSMTSGVDEIGRHLSFKFSLEDTEKLWKWIKKQRNVKIRKLGELRNTRYAECFILPIPYDNPNNLEVKVYREEVFGQRNECIFHIRTQRAARVNRLNL